MWLFYPETLILGLPALILDIYAQYKVRATYAKYLNVSTQRWVTASQVTGAILAQAGVSGVNLGTTPQPVGDHYDPRSKTIRLSAPNSASVAAVGVAAHEAGQALQHAHGYAPLALRSTIVPVAMIGSQLAFPLFFGGSSSGSISSSTWGSSCLPRRCCSP